MWKVSTVKPAIVADGPYCPVWYSWERINGRVVYWAKTHPPEEAS